MLLAENIADKERITGCLKKDGLNKSILFLWTIENLLKRNLISILKKSCYCLIMDLH